MIVVIDKKLEKVRIFVAKLDAANWIGVHPNTISNRLPYFEDEKMIISSAEVEKSGRGTNNLPPR